VVPFQLKWVEPFQLMETVLREAVKWLISEAMMYSLFW